MRKVSQTGYHRHQSVLIEIKIAPSILLFKLEV